MRGDDMTVQSPDETKRSLERCSLTLIVEVSVVNWQESRQENLDGKAFGLRLRQIESILYMTQCGARY